MLKYICLVMLLISIHSFGFGGIIDSASSSVTSVTDQIASQAESIVNSAQNTLQSMASQVVDTTKKALGEVQNAANLAVDTVKNEVDNIVSTINNLSAQMCESQCTSFFNLPCFLLFRCTQKIKKFCFIILLPVVLVMICCFGFSTGLFSIPCLCRVLMLLSGITLIIWLIKRKCKRTQQEKEEEKKKKKEEEGQSAKNNEKDNPVTQNRFSSHAKQ